MFNCICQIIAIAAEQEILDSTPNNRQFLERDALSICHFHTVPRRATCRSKTNFSFVTKDVCGKFLPPPPQSSGG